MYTNKVQPGAGEQVKCIHVGFMVSTNQPWCYMCCYKMASRVFPSFAEVVLAGERCSSTWVLDAHVGEDS